MYNEYLKLHNKKTNDSVKKVAKELNIYLTKEDQQMENKQMNVCTHHSGIAN